MSPNNAMAEPTQPNADEVADSPSSRISVLEIARRLSIGRLAVYSMLEQGIIPGVRLGRRWIITRDAYLTWERTCGLPAAAGLRRQPEVDVVH
jgi:excisionase family DNA binding protein